MLSYDDALARILLHAFPLPSVSTPLLDTPGLVLAQDVISAITLPPFANSAMDGYAVRHADVRNATPDAPITLPVAGEIAAGRADVPTLAPGTALAIMTGAPLPPGADTIIPVEDTEPLEDAVSVRGPGEAGQFIRHAGSDITLGARLIEQGNVIRPLEIAVAAAVGQNVLFVHRRPRVAIISTGDELVEPGQPLGPGQIYNSNAYALAAQVQDAGAEVMLQTLARDTPDALRAALDAAEGADMILTSGGVSVGTHDHVKSVFGERGKVDFWRIAVRPGKPLLFGTWGDALFFGLPGNPVSSLVTFELFARPALRRLLGHAHPHRPQAQAILAQPVTHFPGRRTFLRGRIALSKTGLLAYAGERQGSHQLSALPQTNALLVLPEDVSGLPAGASITAILLHDSPVMG